MRVSVWAGVSGASISNFRSYQALIALSLHSCWPNLPFSNSSTHLYFTFFYFVFSFVPNLSPCLVAFMHPFPPCISLKSHSIFVLSVILFFPVFPLFLSSLLLFDGHFHYINTPSFPPSYPDNHKGPTRTRGRRQDSQSNRSSDQWALYIATVTPK